MSFILPNLTILFQILQSVFVRFHLAKFATDRSARLLLALTSRLLILAWLCRDISFASALTDQKQH